MANICQRLIKKVWRSYANDLEEVPDSPGIYVIGDATGTVLYLGQSKHMRTRLKRRKYGGKQDIDKFVKHHFQFNVGTDLRIKWVEEMNHGCVEGNYLQCLAQRLGYWPFYNAQGGNTCY